MNSEISPRDELLELLALQESVNRLFVEGAEFMNSSDPNVTRFPEEDMSAMLSIWQVENYR